IFTSRNGVYILDLAKNVEKLHEAQAYIHDVVKRGGMILYVGTKNHVKEAVKTNASSVGMPYINEHWIGGLFTNFKIVSQTIQKLKDLKAKQASGDLKKYTKKEQLEFAREIDRLEHLVGGAANLTRLPDAVFVVGAKAEDTAIREARRVGLPIIALVDSNTSPEGIHYVIPGNDDAVKSTTIITEIVTSMIREAQAAPKEPPKTAPKVAEAAPSKEVSKDEAK
ncbi:MAG: 30S ribosomal protein S2, partial [Candidatus Kerfeldbacteria bacterium]|nr:30S ribosomal protein S2 [Candidatus Kerfeldbacteria bacterium]